MICPKCHTDVVDTAKHCPICSYDFYPVESDLTPIVNFSTFALISTVLAAALSYFAPVFGLPSNWFLLILLFPVVIYSYSLILLRSAVFKISGGRYTMSSEQSASLIGAVAIIAWYVSYIPELLVKNDLLRVSFSQLNGFFFEIFCVASLIYAYGFYKIGIEQKINSYRNASIFYLAGGLISGIVPILNVLPLELNGTGFSFQGFGYLFPLGMVIISFSFLIIRMNSGKINS